MAPEVTARKVMYELTRPVFIVGAARSGTTLLGEILSRNRTVAYWVEPRYIWRYGNPRAPSDVRTRHEATPKVSAYIRRRFTEFTRRKAADRFMEKTPSNCFRVPFMHAIFPDGLFLHIVRDGRDAAFSARLKWTSPPEKAALLRRMTSFEIPILDAPFYILDFIRDSIGRQLRPGKGYAWGPVFPGLHEIRKRHSVLETCAIQWRESVRTLQEGLRTVPLAQQRTYRFEDLLQSPDTVLRDMHAFLDLELDPEVFAFASNSIQRDAKNRSRAHLDDESSAFLALIQETLRELGYRT